MAVGRRAGSALEKRSVAELKVRASKRQRQVGTSVRWVRYGDAGK